MKKLVRKEIEVVEDSLNEAWATYKKALETWLNLRILRAEPMLIAGARRLVDQYWTILKNTIGKEESEIEG